MTYKKIMKNFRIIICLYLVINSLNIPQAAAQLSKGPDLFTMNDLETIFDQLYIFKSNCGRFPLSEEGLDALFNPPKRLVCKIPREHHFSYTDEDGDTNWKSWLGKNGKITPKDGWGTVFKYTSDGRVFDIRGSNGYFMTDKSPKHSEGHWQNMHRAEPSEHSPFYQ